MSQLPQFLQGLRVLVVDDNTDILEFITVVLESYGMSVLAVASAAALEVLKLFQPEVLVCDIRMLGESGYNLIGQIRKLEVKEGGHLPAAAITAYQDEDWEESLKAGFEAYLHKERSTERVGGDDRAISESGFSSRVECVKLPLKAVKSYC